MVVMSTGQDHVFPGEVFRTRSDFSRPRVGTWGSDSGCSDVSAASTDSTSASISSRSTIKRRYSPDTSRNDSSRRPLLRIKDEIDEENEEEIEELDDAVKDVSTVLMKSYPHRQAGMELIIVRQPEGHHRARYQKEGSRGCIKDRTGNSCPMLQLKGAVFPGILQIFVATENGKIRPHPLYRACRVGGKRSTPARDRSIDNINVLELNILPENDGMVNIDCLGILKLRNADLEISSETEEASQVGKRRKREPKVRLVFRAVTKSANGSLLTLQVVSTPICCTPSPGMPEIHRCSHIESPVSGGTEVVIIGRNFLKDDTKVFVMEKIGDGEPFWEEEIPLQQEHFQHVHVVGTMPPYRNLFITQAVDVFLVVKNKLKMSEPYGPFRYVPNQLVRQSVASPSLMARPETEPLNMPVDVADMNANQQPTTVEATWMGSADDSSSVFQYCIQPPGLIQPIFITFPLVPETHTRPTIESSMGVLSNQPNSSYDLAHMRLFLDSCNQNGSVTAMGGSLAVENRSDSDEDLFDQMLRDILDPVSTVDIL